MSFDENDGGGMEKVVKLTIMLTEQQAERLSRCQQLTGANASEVTRFCLDHSMPVAIAYPSLVHIIPTIPPQGNQK